MLLKLEFDALVASAYSEGRARFGELGLDLSAFSTRISSILKKHLGSSPAPSEIIAFVKALHGRDLYLATACAQCSPGGKNGSGEYAGAAWKMLESTYKGFVCDLVRFSYRPGFASQDLADSIVTDLFLPDRSGASRIASYDGRSSLSTWLRVIVCNRAINAQRCSANAKSTEMQPDVPDEPALEKIEMTVRARRYGEALEDALASACRALTPRERLVLLWRYEDGLQLGQMAKLLGIHQSNVTRQLEKMQGKLRDDVVAILSSKHRLSRSAIEECLEDVIENPRHSISILEVIKALQHSSSNDQGSPPAVSEVARYRASNTRETQDVKNSISKTASLEVV
ncbi:MAG TPA: sigma-70 family RNA polymerase sigma factor [Candidatus Solibacter sp.]|jgi:RNA polymerase sigma-70 factor|nr:sigma-70 family RNA polymerase sigma factor [Candidatus Solibacter sp.]